MLELGKSGSHGAEKGVVPVLDDGRVVATLRAANWREAATAEVGGRSWVFRRAGNRQLIARWAVDLEDAVRLEARQVSYWRGTWAVQLERTPVEVAVVSRWKGTHRYNSGGRTLAESGTTGGWSPQPTLTVEPGVTLDHAVFLLWFEFVLRRRAAAAAAA